MRVDDAVESLLSEGRVTANPQDFASMIESTYDRVCFYIANDDTLWDLVAEHTVDSDVLDAHPEDTRRLAKHLRRIKPFSLSWASFYRGETEPEAAGARAVQSWTTSKDTVAYFAKNKQAGIITMAVGKIQGVSLTDLCTWRMRVRAESQYPGMQAEWLLLRPKHTTVVWSKE